MTIINGTSTMVIVAVVAGAMAVPIIAMVIMIIIIGDGMLIMPITLASHSPVVGTNLTSGQPAFGP